VGPLLKQYEGHQGSKKRGEGKCQGGRKTRRRFRFVTAVPSGLQKKRMAALTRSSALLVASEKPNPRNPKTDGRHHDDKEIGCTSPAGTVNVGTNDVSKE